METILCAAIWYKEIELKKEFEHNVLPINCDKGLVFYGYRHAHCLYSMASITGLKSHEVGLSIKGFLTSKNRFVDRKEAYQIAIHANQIKSTNEDKESDEQVLISEDLY